MGYKLWVIGIFLLLADTAWAVDYKNSYRHSAVSGLQSAGGIQPSAVAPSAMFRTTSAYAGQWSGSDQSLVNEDGSVNNEAYMSGSVGPRKNSGSGYNPGTPDDGEDPGEQQPLGDGVWILTALACAYLIIRAARKRKLEP